MAHVLFNAVVTMGAWGSGSFENDAALDWVAELTRARSLAPVQRALKKVGRGKHQYIEADDASTAVAAAEVVAALNFTPAENLPESVREWVDTHPQPVDQDLIDLALRAVERVSSASELKDLYEEGGTPNREWRLALADLEERFGRGPNPNAAELLAKRASAPRHRVPSKPKPRIGDVLWIPLNAECGAVGIVLLLPARYKGRAMQLGFFSSVFGTPDEVTVDQLRGPRICLPVAILSLAVTRGLLTVIGNEPALRNEFELPVVYDDYHLFRGDETIAHHLFTKLVRLGYPVRGCPDQPQLGWEEMIRYPTLGWANPAFIEKILSGVLLEGRQLNAKGFLEPAPS